MNSLVKVSVIIPAYNAEPFIEETINSVLRQSFNDWELIIVNDGSTDNTVDIARSFSDDRIRIIDIENRGVSNARNVGFDHSKGDFVTFLDADDIWLSDNLELKVQLLESNEAFGLVHSDCEVVNHRGHRTSEKKSGKSGYLLGDLLLWNGTCIPGPSSVLVRRKVIEYVGGFNLSLSTAADQEFFFRVAAKFQIGRVPFVTWHYRVHGNNMHQNIKRMEIDHINAYKFAEEKKLFKSYWFRKKCFSNLCLILAGSWWVNENKHPRTFLFLLKSLVSYPMNFPKILSKLLP